MPVQRTDDGRREPGTEAGQCRDSLLPRLPHPRHRTEGLHQLGTALRPQAGDVVENRPGHPASTAGAVERDREPVGLVTDLLHQVQCRRIARDNDRVVLPRHPQLFQPLGYTHESDVGDPQFVEHGLRRLHLGTPTVDDEQLWRIGETGGAGLRLPDGDLALETLSPVVTLGDSGPVLPVPAEPAADHFRDRGHVIGVPPAGRLPDTVPTVVGFPGQTVLEDHQTGDDIGALDVGDVGTFDPQGRLVHPQRLTQVLQCGGARGDVSDAGQLVLAQCLAGVLRGRVHQGFLVTPLRGAQSHLRPPQSCQPVGHLRGVLRLCGQENLPGYRLECHLTARRGPGVTAHRGFRRIRQFSRLSVELGEEVCQQARQVTTVGTVAGLHHPAALTTDPSATDVEDLHGGLQVVAGRRDHVGVGRVGEDHGLLLHRGVHRGELVTQGRRAFEVEVAGGLLHLMTDLTHHPLGVPPGEERAEPVDELHVLRRRHPAHTGCRAPVDVPQQTGSSQLLMPAEHAVGAGTYREHPCQ